MRDVTNQSQSHFVSWEGRDAASQVDRYSYWERAQLSQIEQGVCLTFFGDYLGRA